VSTSPVPLPSAPDTPTTTDPLTAIPRLVVVGQVEEAVMLHDVPGASVWTRSRAVRVHVWVLAGQAFLGLAGAVFGQFISAHLELLLPAG
jgi:hypothetical protein